MGTTQNVGPASFILTVGASVDDLMVRQDDLLEDGVPTGKCGLIDLAGQLFSAAGGVGANCNGTTFLGGGSVHGDGLCDSVALRRNSSGYQGTDTSSSGLTRMNGDGNVGLRMEINAEGDTIGAQNSFDVTKSVGLPEKVSLILRFLTDGSERITFNGSLKLHYRSRAAAHAVLGKNGRLGLAASWPACSQPF